jgi:hypothetical protein
MGKFKLLLLILFIVVLLALGRAFLLPLFKSANSFLKVTTQGTSTVYLDGRQVGETPYFGERLTVGEYTLKIAGRLNSKADTDVEFSTKISLTPQALTAVNYEFGPSKIFSSGDIRTFKEGEGLSVLSEPGDAVITLDGEAMGKTPLSAKPNAGTHKLKVAKEGYFPRELEINLDPKFLLVVEVFLAKNPFEAPTKQGDSNPTLYTLTTADAALSQAPHEWAAGIFFFEGKVNFSFDALLDESGQLYYQNKEAWEKKLASSQAVTVGYLSGTPQSQLSSQATASLEDIKKVLGAVATASQPQVQIQTTPTGTLNLRGGPGTGSPSLGQVRPGETYMLLGEVNGWFKIKAGSTEGWVSAQYAKKL